MPFFVDNFFCFPNGFADKHAAVPNFSLVNQSSLDKILKVEVFVHSDCQLRAAHLILGYNPPLIKLPGVDVRDQSKGPSPITN